MPHGFCLLWQPGLVWTMVIADIIVAISYASIPIALVYFTLKRRDVVFPWVFLLFGAFILLCGSTHVMEAVVLWVPLYDFEALLKALTAVVSLATAVCLWPLMPRALALPGFGELRRLNTELEHEIAERRHAEMALRDANLDLETRVAERTQSLTRLTEELRAEIAERQRSEEGLRASTELLRATVDAAPVPIAVTAPDTTVVMWNRSAELVFGYTANEIIGRPCPEMVAETGRAELEAQFRRALAGETLRAVQLRQHDRHGEPLEINFSSVAVREPDGRVQAVVSVFEDVTQRNAIEAQLRQAQKMEAIGNLTGGMAHDFNNLLGVIIGNLDSIEGDLAAQSENGERIRHALEAALRGAELTKHLLAFGRRQPLNPERIDLNEHVDRTAALLRRTLGEDIVVKIEFDPAPWPVLVDASQLASAITNLATNARDAMPRGGKLILRTAKAHLDAAYVAQHPETEIGDYAMVEVCDTGIGIRPEILRRIFEPFFTTKEEGKGSGLGLAMVFGFIKQSGGHINVYSEVGKGTCFRLYLPRADAAAEADAPAGPAEKPAVGHETVLVVEDNAMLRVVVVRQLVSLGYEVHQVESAAAALALLRDGLSIDLLFTDIVMPGDMNGAELGDAARALVPGLKVLLTSGFPEARAEGSGWSSNYRLLVKPYRKDDLARIVRQVLDE